MNPNLHPFNPRPPGLSEITTTVLQIVLLVSPLSIATILKYHPTLLLITVTKTTLLLIQVEKKTPLLSLPINFLTAVESDLLSLLRRSLPRRKNQLNKKEDEVEEEKGRECLLH
jgi:hypothetical protein